MIRVFIPARLSSTRLPGKPLICIDGQPQIVRLLKSLTSSLTDLDVTVVTDSEAIEHTVRRVGFDVIRTSDAANGTERIAQAVRKSSLSSSDFILNLQGDLLLNEDGFIVDAISQANDFVVTANELEWATFVISNSATHSGSTSSVWALVNKTSNKASNFLRSPSKPQTDKGIEALEHIGMYLYSRALLEKYHSLGPSHSEIEQGLEQMRLIDAQMMPTVFRTQFRPLELNTESDYINALRNG